MIGARLHAEAVRAVRRDRRCQDARRQVPGQLAVRAAVHRLLRLGAMSASAIAPPPPRPSAFQECSHDRSRQPAQDLQGQDRPVHAVDGVSFKARDGEITGLLGPNGAGKTTTLRMLYTLMRPSRARARRRPRRRSATPTRCAAALGVLPDARGVYKRLTARENIAYFGELHGMSTRRRSRSAPRSWSTALRHGGLPRPPDRRLLAGPAHQDRDRARAGARPAAT